jgi:uncharacterized protein (TIGR02246 family)
LQSVIEPLTQRDIADIKALGSTLDTAALAGDWGAIAALFTEDVCLMFPNGPILRGREEFREWLGSVGYSASEHRIEFQEVDGYGDLAYARGEGTETFITTGMETPVTDTVKILSIVRKQAEGSWRIAIWMWSSDLPLFTKGSA